MIFLVFLSVTEVFDTFCYWAFTENNEPKFFYILLVILFFRPSLLLLFYWGFVTFYIIPFIFYNIFISFLNIVTILLIVSLSVYLITHVQNYIWSIIFERRKSLIWLVYSFKISFIFIFYCHGLYTLYSEII